MLKKTSSQVISITSLLHLYYIILCRFCQEVFKKYLQLFFLYKTYHRTHPTCFCGFFTLIVTVLRSISSAVSVLSTVSCLSVLCSPLDYINIIPHNQEKVKMECCTNFQQKNGEKYTKCTKRRAPEANAPSR